MLKNLSRRASKETNNEKENKSLKSVANFYCCAQSFIPTTAYFEVSEEENEYLR